MKKIFLIFTLFFLVACSMENKKNTLPTYNSFDSLNNELTQKLFADNNWIILYSEHSTDPHCEFLDIEIDNYHRSICKNNREITSDNITDLIVNGELSLIGITYFNSPLGFNHIDKIKKDGLKDDSQLEIIDCENGYYSKRKGKNGTTKLTYITQQYIISFTLIDEDLYVVKLLGLPD